MKQYKLKKKQEWSEQDLKEYLLDQIQVDTINLSPLAGTHIDELKSAAKILALTYKCKILFWHNSKEFICDLEGNIAQTN